MLGRLTLRKHARLVDRMATALGLDLEERALRGEVSFDEISDAVLACTGCANADGCERWLEAVKVPQETAPSYCQNTALFKRLK